MPYQAETESEILGDLYKVNERLENELSKEGDVDKEKLMKLYFAQLDKGLKLQLLGYPIVR